MSIFFGLKNGFKQPANQEDHDEGTEQNQHGQKKINGISRPFKTDL